MPAANDWYRCSTWSPRDREEFDARLAQSRGADRKAQYLRLQACHLHETGDPALLPVALELLDRLIGDFPDPFQLSLAFSLRAEVLIDLGQADGALASYEQALAARRSFPQVIDDAYLAYVELILALKRSPLYAAAQRVLDEFPVGPFPVQVFRDAGARAMLSDARGETATAGQWARTALEAAARSESPFRYHQRLGLLRDADPLMIQQLKVLAR